MEENPYTLEQVEAVRHLILHNGIDSHTPDDRTLLAATSHNPKEVRKLVQRYFHSIQNVSVTTQALLQMFNAKRDTDRQPMRREFSAPPPDSQMLPPKLRQKSIGGSAAAPLPDRAIFRLPQLSAPPQAVIKHRNDHVDPEIGSLAVILHTNIGAPQVCRVLGCKVQNNIKLYLVAFFLNGSFPCYAPSEYLFQINPKSSAMDGKCDFMETAKDGEVNVDWILEKILSSAQSLVIKHSEVLLPNDDITKANFQIDKKQIETIGFQCVSLAALLFVCYISSRWTIPNDKITKIVSAILMTNPPKYISTKNIFDKIEVLLKQLLK